MNDGHKRRACVVDKGTGDKWIETEMVAPREVMAEATGSGSIGRPKVLAMYTAGGIN